mmetsp:Transcript_3220/g.7975  ORF Transcript_3220/g.7975 Transcript_3220/m.7975 type:complete len:233 (+) Transcript_3220:290-988(+)
MRALYALLERVGTRGGGRVLGRGAAPARARAGDRVLFRRAADGAVRRGGVRDGRRVRHRRGRDGDRTRTRPRAPLAPRRGGRHLARARQRRPEAGRVDGGRGGREFACGRSGAFQARARRSARGAPCALAARDLVGAQRHGLDKRTRAAQSSGRRVHPAGSAALGRRARGAPRGDGRRAVRRAALARGVDAHRPQDRRVLPQDGRPRRRARAGWAQTRSASRAAARRGGGAE